MSCVPCVSCMRLRTDLDPQYSTQWDRSTLFTYTNLGPYGELNFTSSEPSNSVTISVDDTTVYQQMVGFGATLSTCGICQPSIANLNRRHHVCSRFVGQDSQRAEGELCIDHNYCSMNTHECASRSPTIQTTTGASWATSSIVCMLTRTSLLRADLSSCP